MDSGTSKPGSLDVDGKDPIKLILRLFLQRSFWTGDAGVVHQDVHAAELAHRFLDHRIDLIPAGQIDRNGQHPPASGVQLDGGG